MDFTPDPLWVLAPLGSPVRAFWAAGVSLFATWLVLAPLDAPQPGASAFCLWLLGTRCAQRAFSQKQFLSWFLFERQGCCPAPGKGFSVALRAAPSRGVPGGDPLAGAGSGQRAPFSRLRFHPRKPASWGSGFRAADARLAGRGPLSPEVPV